MLEARRTGFWRSGYDISADGQPLTRWARSVWRSGGSFTLEGRRYEVQANFWGTGYQMSAEDGAAVAQAQRVGRRSWTVTSGGRTYEFTRASLWRDEQVLLSGGQRVGAIRRISRWSGAAAADLPGLPLPVQVFVFAVVLTMWDRAGEAASSS